MVGKPLAGKFQIVKHKTVRSLNSYIVNCMQYLKLYAFWNKIVSLYHSFSDILFILYAEFSLCLVLSFHMPFYIQYLQASSQKLSLLLMSTQTPTVLNPTTIGDPTILNFALFTITKTNSHSYEELKWQILFILFFLVILRIEPRDLLIVGKHCITQLCPHSQFVEFVRTEVSRNCELHPHSVMRPPSHPQRAKINVHVTFYFFSLVGNCQWRIYYFLYDYIHGTIN